MNDPQDADVPDLTRRATLCAATATLVGASLADAAWPDPRNEPQRRLSTPPRPALPFVPTLSPAIEAAKKNAFILIPYGLYVLGVAEGERLHAAAINWVMQSAYRQPQFTMGLRRPGEYGIGAGPAADALYAALLRVRRFSLSLLGNDQADVARSLLEAPEIEAGRINGAAFHTAMTGAPILSTAPAWFEARIEDTMESTDHTLCLCTVTNAGNTVERPLLMDRDATTRPKGWL
jgi:flavin reductase (DIM6/NTAB) family NADH-FMN oxidoreductase RutF